MAEFDLRHVENVIDDSYEPVRFFAHNVKKLLRMFEMRVGYVIVQRFDVSLYLGQRRAKLVRDMSNEIRFQDVCLFQRSGFDIIQPELNWCFFSCN